MPPRTVLLLVRLVLLVRTGLVAMKLRPCSSCPRRHAMSPTVPLRKGLARTCCNERHPQMVYLGPAGAPAALLPASSSLMMTPPRCSCVQQQSINAVISLQKAVYMLKKISLQSPLFYSVCMTSLHGTKGMRQEGCPMLSMFQQNQNPASLVFAVGLLGAFDVGRRVPVGTSKWHHVNHDL